MRLRDLPTIQSEGSGTTHRCPRCAYEAGYEAGFTRPATINVDLKSLKEKQEHPIRHRSAYAAWALGFMDGVLQSYGVRSEGIEAAVSRPPKAAPRRPPPAPR